jgi:hypothetical protein
MSVEFIIPVIFDCYFIIHKNYGIIDEFPFDEYPENNTDLGDLNKRHEIERYFELFLRDSKDRESLYRPLSLKELAVRFNTEYHVDMFEKIKDTPGIWPLRKKTFEKIASLLFRIKKQDPLCFYINDYYRFNFDVHHSEDKQTMEKSELEYIPDYIEFQWKSNFDSCSYLFPKDHLWCLATFEDLSDFIFACDDKTAEELSNVEGLEYFKISRDYESPNGWFLRL